MEGSQKSPPNRLYSGGYLDFRHFLPLICTQSIIPLSQNILSKTVYKYYIDI